MSRRTLDTEIITIRQVNALTPTNSVIPALTTLTSDGQGGTFWAIPSSLGGIPAINQVVVDNLPFPATTPFNTLYLSTAQGLGSVTNSTTNLITLYSKCFDTFDISGGNRVTSYAHSTVSPTITLVGKNGIAITGDPFTRTLTFDTQASAISTGIYAYSKFNVISNASTLEQEAILNSNNSYLTASSVSTVLNLVGVGDILLNANASSNSVFINISTFNSENYLNISTLAYQTYGSTLSTVSSLFCGVPALMSTASTLSNYAINNLLSTSSSLQRQITFSENNVMNFYTNVDLFKLLSTAVDDINENTSNSFSNVNAGIASTISYSSSINIDGFQGIYTGTVTADQHITVSTAQFRLDTMSSIINKGAQVVLTYSPSLLYNFLITASEVATVSTFIMAGNTILADSTFVRPWFVPLTNQTLVQPFLYTDTMTFTIKNATISPYLHSTLTLYHHVDLDFVSYPNNQASAQVNYLTHGNCLSVALTGMNYTP